MRGVQNGTHTIIEFRRVLDTCDPDDYVLSADTVRIIWALHDSDPQHGAEMVYHGEKRGAQSIHLLGPPPVPKAIAGHFTNWDITLKNVPRHREKHSTMVHHMIMHECELDKNANVLIWDNFAKEEGRMCYSDMPPEWEKCLTPLVAWAVGSKGEYFPDHVGLPLAGKTNSYYMLEVHFDNPLMVFPKDGINVVSVMLHSHLAGRKLKLRHIRAGKELAPLAEDDHYDFNYQQSRSLSQDTPILPGDGLITECSYSTALRRKPTLGGYSTQEEMCLAFVLHYPRTQLAGCYSIPPVKYFFETLGIREFYGKDMMEIEQALLEEKVEVIPTTTPKPFENKPGDEMSPEANMRAIMALRNAKEYSIEGDNGEGQSVFDKLVIKDPLEFRNLTFTDHLQNIPYNETIFTKKIEEYFYKGLHLTFCRKRDDSLAIKENIEKLPDFQEYEKRGKYSVQLQNQNALFIVIIKVSHIKFYV
ncbi:hypothetical protein NQ314_003434 [Rhamnusium bicolor]|uniref:DOMON domain-containing protein n=1 Tax=Rhamnusium bicolor TaxID=1586634 RepID=A0AAV8ZNT4_9CUCU|nr:hypothetical protein NQ314_003434 [Rhamnusium bicolor]